MYYFKATSLLYLLLSQIPLCRKLKWFPTTVWLTRDLLRPDKILFTDPILSRAMDWGWEKKEVKEEKEKEKDEDEVEEDKEEEDNGTSLEVSQTRTPEGRVQF